MALCARRDPLGRDQGIAPSARLRLAGWAAVSPPDRVAWRPPAISRRQVLRAAALGLAAPALLGGLSGCAFGSDPDPLLALAATARADGALIDTAGRTFPQLAAPLTPVAAARREHAAALDTEIARLDSDYTPPSTPPSSSPAAPRSDAGQDAALTAVLQSLASSARQAADVVGSLPGHRAGLVGSIAACCGAYRAVLG